MSVPVCVCVRVDILSSVCPTELNWTGLARPVLGLGWACFHVYLFAKLVLTLVIQPDIRRRHFRQPSEHRDRPSLHVFIITTCLRVNDNCT